MKARHAHAVPLSKLVISYLTDLAEMLGHEGYMFPSARTSKRPMSENTLNAAFRRMGYSKDEVTAHGLRATASTFLNESGLWNPDAIERALAHGDSNIAPRVELGGEAAARSAKRLGLLSPLFMPTAQ